MTTLLEKLGLKRKQKEDDSLERSMLNANSDLLNRLAPDSLQENEDHVRSGGNYTRTLVAVEFEPIISQEKIQELSEMNSNVSIVQHISEYDRDTVKSKINQSIKQNRGKLEMPGLSESAKVRAEQEIIDAEMLLRDLTTSNKRMFMFQLMIHIVASTEDELKSLTSSVRSQAGTIGKFQYPKLRAKDAFDSYLPLGKNKVYDLTFRPMTNEAVSYFFPFHENEIYHEGGIMYGKNIKTGNIVKVNDELTLNKHMTLIGVSGSGKTSTLIPIMLRSYARGESIRLIDPKGDFGEIVKALGGEWIEFSLNKEEHQKRINPFDIPAFSASVDEEGKMINSKNNLFDKISTLMIMFKLMYRDITDLQEDVLSEIVLEMYASEKYGNKVITPSTDISKLENTDFPIMNDLYEYLQEIKTSDPKRYEIVQEFHETLTVYAKGYFQNIFNGHTNVDLNKKLVCYDIKNIAKNEKAKRILYFNILSAQRQAIVNGDKRPTKLIIDEAHNIADPEIVVAMEYLYEMMKVLREFNCGIICATQSVKDFLSAKTAFRNYGEAVISQSIQQFYLKMRRSEVEVLNEELALNLSEDEMKFLTLKDAQKTKEAGKGFFYVGSNKVQIQVFHTDIEKKLWFEKDYSVFDRQ